MDIYEHRLTLTLPGFPSPTVYELISGSVSIDESRLPYVQASCILEYSGLASVNLDPDGVLEPTLTLERFPAGSTVADQTLETTLSVRLMEISSDYTISLDLASAEALLGDLIHPLYDRQLLVPSEVASLTVGAALSWLFDTHFATEVRTAKTFTLTGTVPSIPIVLADDETNLKLLEGQRYLDWMDSHLRRAGKVLRADETGTDLVIADRITGPGSAVVASAETNMVSYREVIDRDREFAGDLVTVHYRPDGVVYASTWPQPDDVATSIQKVLYVDKSDEFSPINQFTVDPEAEAQGILERLESRRRQVTARLLSDYTWRPGMTVTITTPFGSTLAGVVQSIRWLFPENEMDVEFRDVVPL